MSQPLLFPSEAASLCQVSLFLSRTHWVPILVVWWVSITSYLWLKIDPLEPSVTAMFCVIGPSERDFDYWLFDLPPTLPLALTVEYPSEIHKAPSDINWILLLKKKKICFDFRQYQGSICHMFQWMLPLWGNWGQSVKTTNQVLGIIKVTFQFKENSAIRILRPQYCI